MLLPEHFLFLYILYIYIFISITLDVHSFLLLDKLYAREQKVAYCRFCTCNSYVFTFTSTIKAKHSVAETLIRIHHDLRWLCYIIQ